MTEVNAGRPAKPMRADARRNYERLVREAAVVFAESGENASLDDIAKRAGVGSGTLYRHFPSRRELLEAVYVENVEDTARRARELGAAKPPGQALEEWLGILAEQMAGIKGLRALLGSAAADCAQVNSVCTGLREAAHELLVAAQESGEMRRDLDAADLLRLVHAVTAAAEGAGPDETGGTARRYLGVLVEGCRTP